MAVEQRPCGSFTVVGDVANPASCHAVSLFEEPNCGGWNVADRQLIVPLAHVFSVPEMVTLAVFVLVDGPDVLLGEVIEKAKVRCTQNPFAGMGTGATALSVMGATALPAIVRSSAAADASRNPGPPDGRTPTIKPTVAQAAATPTTANFPARRLLR
ncbi:MAG: hypothetical protein ACYDHU_10855 [Acidimicrobiales bacterium]